MNPRDDLCGDRLIGGAWGDGPFGYEDLLTLGIDAEADDLMHAVRDHAAGGEDEQILVVARAAFHFDHGGSAHVEVAPTSVTDLGFDVVAVVQRLDFAADAHGLAVEVSVLPPTGMSKVAADARFHRGFARPAGSAMVVTQPIAFWLINS